MENVPYFAIGLFACAYYFFLRHKGIEKKPAGKIADTAGLYLLYFLLFVFAVITIIYT
jgi:hypothetical protein